MVTKFQTLSRKFINSTGGAAFGSKAFFNQNVRGPRGPRKQGRKLKANSPRNINNFNSVSDSLNSISRDAEWYETTFSAALTHAAAPNTLRCGVIFNLHDYISIGDEEVRVYDKMDLCMNIAGPADGWSQDIHYVTATGSSTMSAGSVSSDPTAGFWANLETSTGGTEFKFLGAVRINPIRDNGSWFKIAKKEIPLLETIQRFTDFSEKTINQGRAQPRCFLLAIGNGTASLSTTHLCTLTYAWHTRKRRHQI